MSPRRALIMAGGTGGHVYPALAVAGELRNRGWQVHWVGTRRGLEARVVPAAGIPLHTLAVRGLRGKNPVDTLVGALRLFWSLFQALAVVFRFRPDCVVGMGGYVAGPAGLAAWLLRRPLLIHEQNAVAGTTNRLLAPLARTVVAGFPGAFREAVNPRELGNPVRQALVAAAAEHPWDYHGQRPLQVLVLGGSLGAQPINSLMPEALRLLHQQLGEDSVAVWHQSGEAHRASLELAYDGLAGGEIRISAFIEDMAEAYSWADVVLCRAGALTVAELAVMGRPALLVPLPHAIDDHQTANARALSDRGAALLLRQAQLTASQVAGILADCIANPRRLAAMAAAAAAAARPRAAQDVADCVEELLNHG